MRVMLISTDLRFRRAVSLLLARRGCAVSVGESVAATLGAGEHGEAEVVVIDGGSSPAKAARLAATVQACNATVGVVLVGDRPQSRLDGLRVIPKWGPFETLFAAVEQAALTAGHAVRAG